MSAGPPPAGSEVLGDWELSHAGGWIPARVPGTVAAALHTAGVTLPDSLDAHEWCFRTRFDAPAAEAGEEVVLRLGGIATVASLELNGEPLLESASMFEEHRLDVGGRLRGANELLIRCRALSPLLQARRRPRARWRTRVVAEGNLRFFRTSMLGRAPGFAPGPAPVGPWRPVTVERRRAVAVDAVALRPHLDGDAGVLDIRARLRSLGRSEVPGTAVELSGPSGRHRCELGADGSGRLVVPSVARWWPHSHGEPALHDVRLLVGDELELDAGRVGFRELANGCADLERDGLELRVNGVPVFARGAVWTPVDPVGLAPSRDALRAAIEQAREAGMNVLRIPGTGTYESDDFHDLCDELGMLVWQDFMFANLDYPIADEAFRATVEREAEQQLARVVGRPSLAVLCGNSEIEQQVAMLGLDPALGRGELFGELLPRAARSAGADVPYVPSAPCGGELPFRPDRGVANYFGVGAYLRPLEDVRRAEVRFASECLAFANVPDDGTVEAIGSPPVHDPRWKAAVPRDVGAGWDFEDVRDHYLRLLYGVDPVELRWSDSERYLELSRAVTGEVMAEVFGEWRRAASPCGGGIVLWLRDLVAGAGWGVVDAHGVPKVAYHHLRRALAPVAVWTTDEGLGGIAVHVANDRPDELVARLRVTLYRDFEQRVDEAATELRIGPHGHERRGVEGLLGHFADVSWAYRFGSPAQDLVVATLESGDPSESRIISQAMRFPAGRPLVAETAGATGLTARAETCAGGAPLLRVGSRRLAYGVRVHAPGYRPSDDAFAVEPGGERLIELEPLQAECEAPAGALTALNVRGRVPIEQP